MYSTPIESGCRVCLLYDLSFPETIPRPTLVSVHPSVQELQDILTAWNKLGFKAPQKAIYVLDSSHSVLAASSLEDRDTRLVDALSQVAPNCGFKSGLATVRLQMTGRGWDRGGGRRDPSQYEVEELDKGHEIEIEELYDMHNKLLAKTVPFDEKREIMPKSFVGLMSNGDPDEAALANLDSDSDDGQQVHPIFKPTHHRKLTLFVTSLGAILRCVGVHS